MKVERFRKFTRISAAVIFLAWALTLPASIVKAADAVHQLRMQIAPVCMLIGWPTSLDFRVQMGQLIAEKGGIPGANCYVITHLAWRSSDKSFAASLAGFAEGEPGQKEWSIDQAIGLINATVSWNADHTGLDGILRPVEPAKITGGSQAYSFPWQVNTKVLYGVSGVHPAWTGFANMQAVDLVSWDNISGYASDAVYAAGAGTVTYICRDAHSMAVLVGSFLYVHLVVDNNLVENESVFNQGDQIGNLVHGDFNDTCGYADNGNNSHGYHLHFGFYFDSSSQFYAGGCDLSALTQVWRCGTDSFQSGDLLTNTGATGGGGGGGGGGGQTSTEASFWSYLIQGATGIVIFVAGFLPGRQPFYNGMEIVNWAGIMMTVLFQVSLSNFNLLWPSLTIALVLGGETTKFSIKAYLFIKNLIPGA